MQAEAEDSDNENPDEQAADDFDGRHAMLSRPLTVGILSTSGIDGSGGLPPGGGPVVSGGAETEHSQRLQDSLRASLEDGKTRAYAQRRQGAYTTLLHNGLAYGAPLFALAGSTTFFGSFVNTDTGSYAPLAGFFSLIAAAMSGALRVQDLKALAAERSKAADEFDEIWMEMRNRLGDPTLTAKDISAFHRRIKRVSSKHPPTYPWVYRRAADRVRRGEPS